MPASPRIYKGREPRFLIDPAGIVHRGSTAAGLAHGLPPGTVWRWCAAESHGWRFSDGRMGAKHPHKRSCLRLPVAAPPEHPEETATAEARP